VKALTLRAVAGQPGEVADLEAEGWDDTKWSQAKWAQTQDAPTTDDGACYIVSEESAPDPSKQWFFCSDPSEDEGMQCELVPEWMGQAPENDSSTGHAVWLCSSPKVKA